MDDPQPQVSSIQVVDIFNLVRQLVFLATSGATIVILLLLVGVWRTGVGVVDTLKDLFTLGQSEPRADVRAVVVQQMRSASDLTTAVFTMQTIVPASRDRTLGGYVIGTTTLLYIGYGEVQAGVDLSQLQPQDVQVYGDRLTIQLPPPEILDSQIDVTRSSVYDYNRGFLSLGPDVAPELHELAQQRTLEQILTAACEEDILSEANTRATEVVQQLLATTGYANVVVQTQPPSANACASSVAIQTQ